MGDVDFAVAKAGLEKGSSETTDKPREKAVVFVGIPVYLNRIEDVGLLFSILHMTKDNFVGHGSVSSSANCLGFNKLWIEALNLRPKFTHFLMIHSDIVPFENHFLDKMVSIMEETGADILSAVSPIKDHNGFTSTALDEGVGEIDQRWRVRRLTMHEIYAKPPTWTDPNLLINTGLMLVDIRKPWVDKIHFHFDDDIIVDSKGRKRAVCFPEDWNFSRDARKLGASMYATREIKLRHVGPASYTNTEPWGTKLTDEELNESAELKNTLDIMEAVDGWFSRAEGSKLYETAVGASQVSPVTVEIGSWKGRSTIVLGMVAKRNGGKVYSVDPHDGDLWSNGKSIKTPNTLAEFKKNMVAAGLNDTVTLFQKKSKDVEWVDGKIGLLFIDGLHDYESVKSDFRKFEPHLAQGALIAFHDYNEDGVRKAVDEIVESGTSELSYNPVDAAGSLKVLQRVDPSYRMA
jgi:predicted O-methyltransferase YrrM